ncbi:DUF881 domain-containing protein [Streptomyces sp. XM4011]|uniref:Uncharacterized conserved protein YlxW, UPF0749 family n=1 Tax=Streptomyces harbinensis TaxID=1176198 RepID=A0A1I6T0V9_9ACTN|nr:MULTISPECIES: DUF881 domain-containing protein [Streptomyces]MCK1816881.1 DUF881 domain-containing protein [Streptomyces sp. XM4011]QKV69778.1 DUF881 domain-containing protein [Streptomyces harbinensis]SFS82770.1 Uncharacterized conserved protein YlxW, UPF0749 family [Streptomyces harbinensis]
MRVNPIRPARLGTIAVFALAGLLFWVSFSVSGGSNIRTDDSLLQMSDLIRERDRDNARLEADAAELRAEVDALTKRESGADPAGSERLARAEDAAGLTELTGDALTVTLTDAPPDAVPLLPGIPDPLPNDLVIHQQDLQAVVNALWAGGAEGIQVMDQRLISTSAVRCVGNTLILQGQLYSPPYTVTAVGDRDALRAALDEDPVIQNYRAYVDAYGLGWKVEENEDLTLAAYNGSTALHYAGPTE